MTTELATRLKDSYQWKNGSRFKVDPGVVGARLEQLAELGSGQITTEMVANEATDLNSPLYELFEHDIELAAYEYHKQQARQIVNNLVIVTVIPAPKRNEPVTSANNIIVDLRTDDGDGDDDDTVDTPVVARAFPSVFVGGNHYYTPLQVVLRDSMLKSQYLAGIYNELKSLARKAKDFKIFGEVVEAIDALPELAETVSA